MIRAKLSIAFAAAILILFGGFGSAGLVPAGVRVQVAPRDRDVTDDPYYNDRNTYDNDDGYYDRDGNYHDRDAGNESLREHQHEERERLREHQQEEREESREQHEEQEHHDGGLHFDIGR